MKLPICGCLMLAAIAGCLPTGAPTASSKARGATRSAASTRPTASPSKAPSPGPSARPSADASPSASPEASVPPGPGFYGVVTLKGVPLVGRAIDVMDVSAEPGAADGQYMSEAGQSLRDLRVRTDDQGRFYMPFPRDKVAPGALLALYESEIHPGETDLALARLNPDQGIYFWSPIQKVDFDAPSAIDASFDLAWSNKDFAPKDQAEVGPGPLHFQFPTLPKALKYEVVVSDDADTPPYHHDLFTQEGAEPSFTWPAPVPGTHRYIGRAYFKTGRLESPLFSLIVKASP
jgi:hypothetical protein